MKSQTLRKLRKLFAVLAAAMAALLIVASFVLHTLHKSRQGYFANAEETSRNLAIRLEHFLRDHSIKMAPAMRRKALESAPCIRSAVSAMLPSALICDRSKGILHARSVRGSDRDGRAIYCEEISTCPGATQCPGAGKAAHHRRLRTAADLSADLRGRRLRWHGLREHDHRHHQQGAQVSIERIGECLVFVGGGLSSDDFLAPRRRKAFNDATFLALLLITASSSLLCAHCALGQLGRTADKQTIRQDRGPNASRNGIATVPAAPQTVFDEVEQLLAQDRTGMVSDWLDN